MKPLIFLVVAGLLIYLGVSGKADSVVKGLFT